MLKKQRPVKLSPYLLSSDLLKVKPEPKDHKPLRRPTNSTATKVRKG